MVKKNLLENGAEITESVFPGYIFGKTIYFGAEITESGAKYGEEEFARKFPGNGRIFVNFWRSNSGGFVFELMEKKWSDF